MAQLSCFLNGTTVLLATPNDKLTGRWPESPNKQKNFASAFRLSALLGEEHPEGRTAAGKKTDCPEE